MGCLLWEKILIYVMPQYHIILDGVMLATDSIWPCAQCIILSTTFGLVDRQTTGNDHQRFEYRILMRSKAYSIQHLRMVRDRSSFGVWSKVAACQLWDQCRQRHANLCWSCRCNEKQCAPRDYNDGWLRHSDVFWWLMISISTLKTRPVVGM